MRVCGLEDIERVARIAKHDSIYPFVLDDGCKFDQIDDAMQVVLMLPQKWTVLMPTDDSLFIFEQMNHILFEIHYQILPEGRGEKGLRSGKDAVEWIVKNTDCKKIVGMTPNIAAVKYGLKLGFKIEGLISNAWMKNGQLLDLTIIGKEV